MNIVTDTEADAISISSQQDSALSLPNSNTTTWGEVNQRVTDSKWFFPKNPAFDMTGVSESYALETMISSWWDIT